MQEAVSSELIASGDDQNLFRAISAKGGALELLSIAQPAPGRFAFIDLLRGMNSIGRTSHATAHPRTSLA